MDTNLQKYMAFVTAVESGSFTRAAELLHYSQSGISRMIGDLEREWGLALLERGKSGVQLTSDGMKLLPCAKRVVAEYENLQMEVDDLNGLQSGMIRIASVSSVATHWLPRMIRAFRQDYPGVSYELLMGSYSEVENWVRQGRADCGFTGRQPAVELDVIPLERDRLLAVLPEGHSLAALERVPLEALCREPYMELGERMGIEDLFRERGLRPQVQFTTGDDYIIMSMVENGLGVSVLSELVLQRNPYRIVARELETPVCREISLVLRDRRTASLATRRFLNYLDRR